MPITLLPLDLARWDEHARDTLVVSSFIDERPLRGAAGLTDWRLCGKLSRFIKTERQSGVRGETLLFPPGRRLRFTRLIWFGLGGSPGYPEDRFKADVAWMLGVAEKAGARDLALQAPGRATGIIGARRALELLLDVVPDELSLALIEDPAGQKDVAELLRHSRSERASGTG
jgi:hypothetical protein